MYKMDQKQYLHEVGQNLADLFYNQNKMPNLSMCQNEKCLMKKTCYRFTAVPSIRQVYADFKPDANGKCEYHIYKPKKEEER